MNDKSTPTFMDIIRLQDSIRRRRYGEEGIPHGTDLLVALASGMDVSGTVIGASMAEFNGLAEDAARRVCEYLRSEARQYGGPLVEVSIWYLSWAEAVEKLFLETNNN